MKYNYYSLKMLFIDLKIYFHRCHSSALHVQEMTPYEFRENDFLSANGVYSFLRIPSMRQTIQRQLQSQKLLMLGSVTLHGFRPTYLPTGKVCKRHTSLSSRKPTQALSYGHTGKGSRNTLANANQVRDWRIYSDFAQILISRARKLYLNETFGIELNHTVYALDSTITDLCLSLFPWPIFRQRKGAIKLHTLLDLRGSIPTFVIITHRKIHDVNILDRITIELDSLYIVDRGYLDFARLYIVHQNAGYFIIRTKKNFSFDRLYSVHVTKRWGFNAIRPSCR